MRTLILAAIIGTIVGTSAASEAPHIDYVTPFRIKAQPTGVAGITIHGTFPLATEGHPDRSQYEHWFIRRIGETDWQQCSLTEPPCAMDGWSGGLEKFKLSGSLISKPGLLEMKVNEGLVGKSDDSNTVRIPVLEAFGAPPAIVSLSRTSFPTGGSDAERTFRITANNFDPANVRVVFRDEPDVIHPMRVYDGTTIEIKIPDKFRDHEGEIPIFLRTDSGGDSEAKSIKLVKAQPGRVAIVRTVQFPSPTATSAVMAPPTVSANVILANRVRRAIEQQLGADAAKGIAISAKNGAVTLAGAAAADMKQRVTGAATNVAGVKSVEWR